jgi:hypothetical protein
VAVAKLFVPNFGNFQAKTPSHGPCNVLVMIVDTDARRLACAMKAEGHADHQREPKRSIGEIMKKTHARILLALVCLLGLGSVPALAQERNEVGLVIGGIVTPSQTLSPGATLIGPGGTALPNRDIAINSSLTLGAEYDRAFVLRERFAIDGGVDFLASPSDVKLSQQTQNAIGQYAFIFLTPHVRVKFHPDGVFSPWLSFGGGYARFLEKAPTAVPSFKPGTNTGTFVFGGGVDTRTVVHVLKIPIGFRIEVRDFYSGLPNYNQRVTANLQNNLAFNGGLLIRF